MTALSDIMSVYLGSDGEATRALYERLELCGPRGVIAVNLFRACKASERAKVYRGGQRGRGSFKRMAYDRKGWAIDNLTRALDAHAAELGLRWGWGKDTATPGFPWVLYVETPAGQLSFHAPARGEGPDFAGNWDGVRGEAGARVCRFCAAVLVPEAAA